MNAFRIRGLALATPIALALTVALTASASASSLTWGTAQQLRYHYNSFLSAADYTRTAVAVVWQESLHNPQRVAVRTSNDGGQTFSKAVGFEDAREADVKICGSSVNVVYTRPDGSGGWVLERATRDIAASGRFAISRVTRSSKYLEQDQVACTDGRVFVSWRQVIPDEKSRLYITSAPLADGRFGAPTYLGTSHEWYPEGLSIAGGGDAAYAAYVLAGGNTYLKRWSVGPAPGYVLSTSPAQIVAPGTRRNPTHMPVIGVSGDTVAIAWQRCSGVAVRVSADGGDTWTPIRHIAWYGCGSEVEGGSGPHGIAISGRRIALTYSSGGIPNYWHTFLARTTDRFVSFRNDDLGGHQEHVVGFLRVGGQERLADAYDDNYNSVHFRIQQ